MQESDIVELVAPITKTASVLSDATTAMYWLRHAIELALTPRTGPVWLDVPSDIQAARIAAADMQVFRLPDYRIASVTDKQEILALLGAAQRPLVLAGNGIHCSHAKETFDQFIHKYALPVVTTFLGIDLMDSNDQLHVGRVGIKGDRAGNFAVQNCDLLLVLGCSLNVPEVGYDATLFAPKAKICVVDIATEHYSKMMPIHKFIHADLDYFLRELL
jgi:acetolactate synthase-1/2/3 large subunit